MKRLKMLCDPVQKLVRGGGIERRAIWAYAATGPTLADFLCFCRQFRNVRWTNDKTSNWDLDKMQELGAIEIVETET